MGEWNRFWMVWAPTGRAPVYQHRTRKGADAEAIRLANQNPGREFLVLKSVGGFVAPIGAAQEIHLRKSPTTSDVAEAEELPF